MSASLTKIKARDADADADADGFIFGSTSYVVVAGTSKTGWPLGSFLQDIFISIAVPRKSKTNALLQVLNRKTLKLSPRNRQQEFLLFNGR